MKTKIRKIGNSTGTILPAPQLKKIDLVEGDEIDISVENNRIVITPMTKKKYTLDELLAQCNPKAPKPKELKEWDSAE